MLRMPALALVALTIFSSIACTRLSEPKRLQENEPTIATRVSAQKTETGFPPTHAAMKALGLRAARGELKAIDELKDLHERLYQDIDFKKDQDRVLRNLKLMRAAFDEIGKAAATDTRAFDALMYANRKDLRIWTVDAFGIAAGLGNEKALDMLLEYRQHGFLLSSATDALHYAAANNNPRAVEFLVKVLDDEHSKALWHMAGQALAPAAEQGNAEAAAALKRWAERESKP